MSRLTDLLQRLLPVLPGLALMLGTGTAAALDRITCRHSDARYSPAAMRS